MAIQRVRAVVQGRVQGVFFRASTQEEAERLGLRGWVRNRPDGSVETVFEGEENAVTAMVTWLHQGPPSSLVERVAVSAEASREPLPGFAIRY